MKLGYKFMRNALIGLATIALGATGCSDGPEDEGPVPTPADLGVSTITASILNTRVEAGTPESGTVPAVWSEGDRIAARVGEQTFYYLLTAGAGEPTAVFELEGETEEAPMPPFTLVYPAEEGAIPAGQRYVENGFDPAVVVMTAEAEDASGESLRTGALAVSFAKGYSMLVLRLKGDVSVAAITATDGEQPLAGEEKSVTLDCGDGVVLDGSEAKDFRMAIVPGTHALTIRIRTADGRTKLYRQEEAQEFGAGGETMVELELIAPAAGFTSGPYKAGDYYFDGEAEGVVVEVDPTGSAGKIVSMFDMAEDLAWSTDTDTITEAQDEEDGTANMAIVAAIDETYAKYPAFRACAELGEGWYLPAQKELQRVRSVLDAVNETLGWKGGTEMSSESMYWSSTEVYEFRDAMAYTADMGMPGMFAYEKSLLFPVRAFRAFGEIPEAKYKVGSLCEENGKRGIVIWAAKDDSYAKILSLTEQSAAWGPVNTAIGASDEYDGEKNLAAAQAADGSLADYPAFKSCTEQGEGWYLPSLAELKSIARMTAALNTELAKAGGAALQNGYYWSSTEFASDAANSAQSVSMAGAELSSSKSAERYVRAVAYVGDRPVEAQKYAVGDPYELGGEVVGVVFSVTDGGLHGKVMALKNVTEKGRINAMWDKRANASPAVYVELGATDEEDGSVNMAKARENDPNFDNLTAYSVCAALGDGWYIGAKKEMLAMYAVKSEVNAALKANGGSALDNNDYWTSTEGVNTASDSARSAERQLSVNMKDGSTFEYRKYFYNLVRPIRAF